MAAVTAVPGGLEGSTTKSSWNSSDVFRGRGACGALEKYIQMLPFGLVLEDVGCLHITGLANVLWSCS